MITDATSHVCFGTTGCNKKEKAPRWLLSMMSLFVLLLSPFVLQAQSSSVLFRSGEDGYESYRIPSIISTTKGTLLAFCEGRKKPGDAGDIDLLYRRSENGGKTWSSQQVIWDDGANTCGNPCPVVDEETGTIWLIMTHNDGNDTEDKIIHKRGHDTRTVWICKSEDDGHSWSAPADITKEVKDPSWGWYATGPGIGIQVKYGPHKGRLVIPCDHSYDDPAAKGGYGYGSHVIYSDDHGQSWKLGGSIRPKVNECQVVELADGKGTLMMNMRSYFGRHCRTQSLSSDGGLSWFPPADVPDLTEPVCQASIIRYGWPHAKKKSCLLFLNPADAGKRQNMTIKASFDEGKTWPLAKVLHPGPAAYSSIAVMSKGAIACLYEAGEKDPYETIVFEKIAPRKFLGRSGKDK